MNWAKSSVDTNSFLISDTIALHNHHQTNLPWATDVHLFVSLLFNTLQKVSQRKQTWEQACSLLYPYPQTLDIMLENQSRGLPPITVPPFKCGKWMATSIFPTNWAHIFNRKLLTSIAQSMTLYPLTSPPKGEWFAFNSLVYLNWWALYHVVLQDRSFPQIQIWIQQPEGKFTYIHIHIRQAKSGWMWEELWIWIRQPMDLLSTKAFRTRYAVLSWTWYKTHLETWTFEKLSEASAPPLRGHIQALNFFHASFKIGKADTAVKANHNRRAPNPGGVSQTRRGRVLIPSKIKLTQLGFQDQPTMKPIAKATQMGTMKNIISAAVSSTAGFPHRE